MTDLDIMRKVYYGVAFILYKCGDIVLKIYRATVCTVRGQVYCRFRTDSCQGSFLREEVLTLYSLYVKEKGKHIKNDQICAYGTKTSSHYLWHV
jgi:hypothetical protein